MTTAFGTGTVPEALRHALVDCATGAWLLDGTLDYLGITLCPDGTPAFTITGELVVDGQDACTIAAEETCGVVAGEVCGTRL